MSKKIDVLLIALAILLGGVIVPASQAQTQRAAASTSSATNPLTALPASDVAMFIDMQRLLNDALPRVFSGAPARIAQINTEIDNFKTRTGIDPRSFDRVAVGMRFTTPSAGITKAETVMIAHGSFNAGALVAAGRLAAKGKYQEEKYKGANIYTFVLNEQIRMLGLLNMRVSTLAVTALDPNTLALGNPTSVRAAIDAAKGGGRVNPELVGLATRTPNAIIGFGANLTPAVTGNLDLGNEEMTRNIASIRQAYGAISTTETGFNVMTAARTANAEQAQQLNDTLAALKQFGGMMVGQLPGPKGKLARSALDSLRITTQANELQITLAIPQTEITSLMAGS